MSRITLATLVTLLIAPSVQGTASAENYFGAASEYQSKQSAHRFKARIPSHAFGSVDTGAGLSFGQSVSDVVSGGKVVGRDPDPNVRFDLLRDGQYATSR